MSKILFALGGIDARITDNLNQKNMRGFHLCGTAVLTFFALSFFSAAYLLGYLIDAVFTDLLIAFAYSTIVVNFYRFTLSSVMWRCKDLEKGTNLVPPAFSATLVRIGACGFFIVLMSKPIELWLFRSKVAAKLLGNPFEQDRLYANFRILLRDYPESWLVTAVLLMLFLWPIWYRSYSKQPCNAAYEKHHNEMLTDVIKKHFNGFIQDYDHLFEHRGLHAKFRTPYQDPPFNTKLKEIIVNTKGQKLKEAQSHALYNFLDEMPIVSEI